MTQAGDITVLLDAARDGDRGALDRVLSTLYQELHGMARRQLAGQQHGHTLDATALIGQGNREQILAAYRSVRDQLFNRIKQRFGLEGGPTV